MVADLLMSKMNSGFLIRFTQNLSGRLKEKEKKEFNEN